ncbi:MAG: L-fucose/L-arabinose isomerase family protein [Spirochaetota bacterium]
MIKRKLKLGLAPTRRNVFSVEDAFKYKRMVEKKLQSWSVDFVNLDSLNEEGLLYDSRDVAKAAKIFIDAQVDAVFAPHVNFGTEDAVAKLAKKVGKPFLLWGPRDEAPLKDGSRLRDTQCGLFATSKILQRCGVPFSYIINSRVDSGVFERGFKTFMAAARAAGSFLGARIGQISTRPGDFYTVIVNEGELLERWGIEVVPLTLVDVEKQVLDMVKNDKRVKETAEEFKKRVTFKEMGEEVIMKLAALKQVMADWAQREQLSAIAIQCWDALQLALGIVPCFVNSELTAMGIPVACETDINGALTSLLLQNAAHNDSPTFFCDLTIRHPENENSELLWHCGPFPHQLAKQPGKAFVGKHFILPSGAPGTGNWEIKGGDITLARFDGVSGDYSLFMGHARGTNGPFTLGTYLWVEVPSWPRWEEKLIYGPYIHHIVGVHDLAAYALYEAVRFIPGLRADPADPSEGQIRSYLRGEDLGM